MSRPKCTNNLQSPSSAATCSCYTRKCFCEIFVLLLYARSCSDREQIKQSCVQNNKRTASFCELSAAFDLMCASLIRIIWWREVLRSLGTRIDRPPVRRHEMIDENPPTCVRKVGDPGHSASRGLSARPAGGRARSDRAGAQPAARVAEEARAPHRAPVGALGGGAEPRIARSPPWPAPCRGAFAVGCAVARESQRFIRVLAAWWPLLLAACIGSFRTIARTSIGHSIRSDVTREPAARTCRGSVRVRARFRRYDGARTVASEQKRN